jgi:hypothetical protein
MSRKSSIVFLVVAVAAGLSLLACSRQNASEGRMSPAPPPELSIPGPLSIANEPPTAGHRVRMLNEGATRGSLAGGDSIEYRFDLPAGGIADLAFRAGVPGCYRISVLDPAQRILSESSCTSEDRLLLYVDNAHGGTYTLTLAAIATSSYTLDLAVQKQNDAGSGADAGDYLASATALARGRFEALAGSQDRFDFYTFEATGTTVLEFWKGVDARCCLRIVLLDAQERPMSQQGHLSVSPRLTLEFRDAELAPGTYFLRVEAEGDGGKYGFELR